MHDDESPPAYENLKISIEDDLPPSYEDLNVIIRDYLIWSFIVTLLGFSLLGLFSIAYSLDTRKFRSQSNWKQARRCSRKALILNLIATFISVVEWIIIAYGLRSAILLQFN